MKKLLEIIKNKRLEFPKMPIHGPNISLEKRHEIIGFEKGIVWVQKELEKLL